MVNSTPYPPIKKKYPTSRGERRAIIDDIFGIIQKHIPKDNTIKGDELLLILDEAVTNAMEHGNRWDPKKHVMISITCTDSELIIEIGDEGKGFNTDIVASSNGKAGLNTRGRGISLITRMSRAKWNVQGNKVELRVDIYDTHNPA